MGRYVLSSCDDHAHAGRSTLLMPKSCHPRVGATFKKCAETNAERIAAYCVVVAETDLQAEFFPRTLQNKPFGLEETFLETFLTELVKDFLVPAFRFMFWKSWPESPNS